MRDHYRSRDRYRHDPVPGVDPRFIEHMSQRYGISIGMDDRHNALYMEVETRDGRRIRREMDFHRLYQRGDGNYQQPIEQMAHNLRQEAEEYERSHHRSMAMNYETGMSAMDYRREMQGEFNVPTSPAKATPEMGMAEIRKAKEALKPKPKKELSFFDKLVKQTDEWLAPARKQLQEFSPTWGT